MNQFQVFANQESDKYFERNKSSIINNNPINDSCFKLIKENIPADKITSVIELGASNGFRLNWLKDIFPNCKRFVGTDLSAQAVEDGKNRYGLTMHHLAIEENIPEEPFDLVIVCGVLCWVDRENLFKAVYNIDKIVKENGYLLIADFDPFFPQKNIYNHNNIKNVFTFKQDYTQLFLASNTYKELQKKYRDDETGITSLEEKNKQIMSQYNRRSASILVKNSLKYYIYI